MSGLFDQDWNEPGGELTREQFDRAVRKIRDDCGTRPGGAILVSPKTQQRGRVAGDEAARVERWAIAEAAATPWWRPWRRRHLERVARDRGSLATMLVRYFGELGS